MNTIARMLPLRLWRWYWLARLHWRRRQLVAMRRQSAVIRRQLEAGLRQCEANRIALEATQEHFRTFERRPPHA